MNTLTNHVLVVDDEAAVVDVVKDVLERQSYAVYGASSGERALEIFSEQLIDVIITDVRMSGISGFELMKRTHLMDPAVKVIIMTAYDSYDMVRRALQGGAYDYLPKPLKDDNAIIDITKRAIESTQLSRENSLLLERLQASHSKLASANQRLLVLNKKLRILAITDGLTRLYNRRYIDRAVEREAARFGRYKLPYSVLLLDVDHFKRINDEHGHDGGDKVLLEIARTLNNCARETDLVGRYGGEEFVILLPNTTAPNAMVFAERVRTSIETLNVNLETGQTSLTVSIGVSSVDVQSENCPGRDLIAAADQALYKAKDAGRNTVLHIASCKPSDHLLSEADDNDDISSAA